MIPYVVLGATYAFAAAVQPGPLSAYLLAQAAEGGWRRALPISLTPLVTDGPIIALVLLVLRRVPGWLDGSLRLAGGAFLLWLAAGAVRTWRRYPASPPAQTSPRRGLLRAAVVNVLNPSPYLGWSLVLGPLLLRGWREAPAHGIALLVAFYSTMTLSLASMVVVFGAAGRVGPRVGRGLVGVSVVALVAFGCYQLASGLTVLLLD